MIEWRRFSPPATDRLVEELESKTGIELPPIYRAFLRNANGGQAVKPVSFIIPELDEKVMLGALYGLGGGEQLDVAALYFDYSDEIPSGFIPVGEDPGGNLLLVETSCQGRDQVFFWDRIGLLERRCGKRLFFVASDIESLVGLLKEIPR